MKIIIVIMNSREDGWRDTKGVWEGTEEGNAINTVLFVWNSQKDKQYKLEKSKVVLTYRSGTLGRRWYMVAEQVAKQTSYFLAAEKQKRPKSHSPVQVSHKDLTFSH